MTVATAFARFQIGNLSVLDTEGVLSLCARAAYVARKTPKVGRLGVLVKMDVYVHLYDQFFLGFDFYGDTLVHENERADP